MTPEKRETAIKWLTDEIRSLHLAPKINGCGPENWADLLEVMETCYEAVKGHVVGTDKMVPLTLEKLRGMDGPVWCSCKPIEGGDGYWCLCQKGNIITPSGSILNVKKIPHWVFYACQPAHIDRGVFCGSWEGEADGYADGELVYDIWRCSDCGHVEETDDPDWLPDFCPDCGLAMTENARAILEKRLRGLGYA